MDLSEIYSGNRLHAKGLCSETLKCMGLAGSLQHVNIGHERKTTALHSCSTFTFHFAFYTGCAKSLTWVLFLFFFLLSTDGSDGKHDGVYAKRG